MPDEWDLLEFDGQTEIVAGDFPAPLTLAPVPKCLAARPVPPLVTECDPEVRVKIIKGTWSGNL